MLSALIAVAALLPAAPPAPVHVRAEAWSTPSVTRVHVHATGWPGVAALPDTPGDPAWLNVLRNVARLNPAPAPDVTVRCEAPGVAHEVRTSGSGHAECILPPGVASVRVLARGAVPAQLNVLAVPGAPLVVVTDLDDTIFVTGIGDGTVLRRVLTTNAVTREVFPDAPAFYRELSARGLPVVYLSNGPLGTIADRAATLDRHGLPRGPLLLRELDWPVVFDRERHKHTRLRQLARELPGSRLVLVGDTGQRDPEIYAAFAMEHKGRVAAIYLRDVTGAARTAQVQTLTESLRAAGVPAFVSTNAEDFARHARTLP